MPPRAINVSMATGGLAINPIQMTLPWCGGILLVSLALGACAKSVTPTTGGTPPGSGGDTATQPSLPVPTQVNFWLTNPDQSVLLTRQNVALNFGTTGNQDSTIYVDSTQRFQAIDGFGFALTGGSATLINHLLPGQRDSILNELYGSDSNSIGISYLRVSIGASDLSAEAYSYDDVEAGYTDTALLGFNLMAGDPDVVPLLQLILQINPNIKILGSPWSAPPWMKDNDSHSGGSLLPQYYGVYAKYLARYVQDMQAQGIHIDAITPQNEPLNANNNPAMVETALQEDTLVRDFIGPAFAAAGLTTKIIVYDHNCDQPQYPMTILADPAASAYVDGSAFHLYAGVIGALTTVHNAYPAKNVYFTEIYTASTGVFATDLDWHLNNIIIGAPQNWSRNALEWNLASDPNYDPHTPGGCSTCKGALTIGSTITRNVSYYIVAHASKFVPAGSVRIASTVTSGLNDVAFLRPDGRKVLIVVNNASSTEAFNIQFNGKWVTASLNAGAVGTFEW